MRAQLPNPFDPNSAPDVPVGTDEAGASSSAPTPDVPADLSISCCCEEVHPRYAPVKLGSVKSEVAIGQQETAAIDSCQEPVAADLLQALGALSGTDLIHEIFAVKPKHFKLKHKLKLPRFAPDYEAMEAAMHNPNAPRALETDPVWADASPLFLRGRA